ncbi:MAG: hypothetical protein JXQ65_12675 [Candidatus Marinimicrobia bacterium]|nr:hypothetical protein [Candidatus Neomarinimicrobiota bacterium]
MKKFLLPIAIFSLLMSCSNKQSQPDYSSIAWIAELDYQEAEVFPVITTGRIPAPKIPVTVENLTRNCILDLGTYDFVLHERDYDLQQFEPSRLVNRQISTREMMLEEGLLSRVTFLGQERQDIFTYLMKKCEPAACFSGLVGWQFFKDQRITFDLKNNLVGIQTPRESLAGGQVFYTSENPAQKNNMLKFDGFFYNEPVTLSFSTSLRHTQISPEILARLNIRHDGTFTQVDSIQAGQVFFHHVTGQINNNLVLLEPETRRPIDIIIGLNELKHWLLTVDFSNGIFYLKEN